MRVRTTTNVGAILVSVAVILGLVGQAFAIPVQLVPAVKTPFPGFTTTGLHDEADPYMVGTDRWRVSLEPLRPTYLRAVSDNFFTVLMAAYPGTAGWTYASRARELSDNSLVVRTYDAEHRGQAQRNCPADAANRCVGAEFHVEYMPHAGDPMANLHWIQVVTDNHNETNNIGHGNMENIVDVNLGRPRARSPYYDDGFTANATDFLDISAREEDMPHTWVAELFLVTGPAIGAAPGLITFVGGIRWGWENHPVPESPTLVLLIVGLAVALGSVAWRRPLCQQHDYSGSGG